MRLRYHCFRSTVALPSIIFGQYAAKAATVGLFRLFQAMLVANLVCKPYLMFASIARPRKQMSLLPS